MVAKFHGRSDIMKRERPVPFGAGLLRGSIDIWGGSFRHVGSASAFGCFPAPKVPVSSDLLPPNMAADRRRVDRRFMKCLEVPGVSLPFLRALLTYISEISPRSSWENCLNAH